MERYRIFRNGRRRLDSLSIYSILTWSMIADNQNVVFRRGNNYLIANVMPSMLSRSYISVAPSRQIFTCCHEIWVRKGIISNALIGCKHFPRNTVIANGLVKSRNRARTHTHTFASVLCNMSTLQAETVKRGLINAT